MTDQTWDNVLHTDDDGREMRLGASVNGTPMLRLTDAVDRTDAWVYLPKHIADALLLAVSNGPDAMLRDVRPLLDQVAREETNARPEQRYLYAHQIRRALGQLPKCGDVRPELGGARCGRDEHLGDDAWHVDEGRGIRWRDFGDGFDVRGWSPDEMEVGPVDDLNWDDAIGSLAGEPGPLLEKSIASLVDVLDENDIPTDVDRTSGLARFKAKGAVQPFMWNDAEWNAAQRRRQGRES